MESIIINKNRNYTRKIIIFFLILITIYFLGFKFLRNPSDHTYFLLPTKNSVIIFAIFGILACLLGIYIVFISIFTKNAFLRIDQNGIYSGFFIYNKKSIRWSDISRIEIIRYNNNNYIGLFLKELRNDEKFIKSLLFNINLKSMGTPYIIYHGDLECDFNELKDSIFESWKKYR